MKNTGVTQQIPHHFVLYMTFVEVGFVTMVTGQSFVLYSRLHIVLHSRKKLRWCLIMIIVDGIICHVPIIVVAFGTNSPNPGPFIVPYSVYEKVMVTIFFVQELILSGIYIWQTFKMMRIEKNTGVGKNGGSRKLMHHLILVNVVVIILDITILGLEYAGYYQLQTAYKGLVYSVKLKLEFSILNRLMEMVGGGATASLSSTSRSRGIPTVNRSRAIPEQSLTIPMDTFDGTKSEGDRRIRIQDVEVGGGGMGYNAYAHSHGDAHTHTHSGDMNMHRRGLHAGGLGGMPGDGRPIITRTTEVMIRRDDLDGDSDSVTADENSHGHGHGLGHGPGHGRRGSRTRGDVSTSSSEIQFAKA